MIPMPFAVMLTFACSGGRTPSPSTSIAPPDEPAASRSDDPGTTGNSAIVIQRGHGFALSSPDGWVLDTHSGERQGLKAVFHRVGESWKNGSAVMYANVTVKGPERLKTIDDVIEDELVASNAPGRESRDLGSIQAGKAAARLWYLYYPDTGNYEQMAFVDEEKIVVVLVLTARSKESYEAAKGAFRELVGSYALVASAVGP